MACLTQEHPGVYKGRKKGQEILDLVAAIYKTTQKVPVAADSGSVLRNFAVVARVHAVHPIRFHVALPA